MKTPQNITQEDFTKIADAYYATIDDRHPEGNLQAVADRFGITRAKVHKILITMEVIDSPLHRDIVRLKGEGYENEDIAFMLGVSTATVNINLPYEKTVYGMEEKSRGAMDVENYRKREKVFMAGIKRKPTPVEESRELWKKQLEKEGCPEVFDDLFEDDWEPEEDIKNLMPVFTKEEAELFQTGPDVRVLHIELIGNIDENVLKKYGGVKYGRSVSRDVLVLDDMPLHNLHYLIQQLFGFQNYHLHKFTLPEEQFAKLTDNKPSNWLKLMGVIFKNPLRDEDADFWDDDYEGGSPKKYMRSKYTGPYLEGVYDETYQFCRRDAANIKTKGKTIQELSCYYEHDLGEILERIPIGEILAADGYLDDEELEPVAYRNFREYMFDEQECIEDVAGLGPDDPDSQPFVYSVTKELIYTYDFGDDWQFSITATTDVSSLLDSGRINEKELRNDIKFLCERLRPVLLCADGYPLVEDAGGEVGYCQMLEEINGKGIDFFDPDYTFDYLAWAKNLGWKQQVPGKKLL